MVEEDSKRGLSFRANALKMQEIVGDKELHEEYIDKFILRLGSYTSLDLPLVLGTGSGQELPERRGEAVEGIPERLDLSPGTSVVDSATSGSPRRAGAGAPGGRRRRRRGTAR